MKKYFRFFVPLIFGLIIFAAVPASAGTPKSEAELIQQLHSTDWREVHAALGQLTRYYSKHTEVIPLLKTMLRSNSLAADPQDVTQLSTKNGLKEDSEPMAKSMPPLYLSRQAARALASFHAEMSEDDLQQVYRFLKCPDTETKMDGLKALRAFNAPGAVPLILPLLQDPNQHVVRDACRTLAVLGDKSVIPSLQPLVKNPNQEISRDASDAILMLQNSK